MTFNITKVREDFPILKREVNGKPLVYLDNGASAQKPQVVIDAITQAYSSEYANVHRGLHYLSNLATDKYESVRSKVAKFLNSSVEDSIVFNSGTTEGINLIAYAWAMPRLQAGDEIVLSIMEHHANIIPWHFLRERMGIKLIWVDVDANGDLDPERMIAAMTERTKLVAITHLSNVLGTVVDVKTITKAAHDLGAVVLVDGSQAAVHMAIDVEDIDCDFYAISCHKMYGPSGSGAIYIRPERMAEMRPFMGGGDMIRDVGREVITYNSPPMMFEAGTPGIVQQIGLGVALDYMMDIGMENIAVHERDLCNYARGRLDGLNWLNIQGKPHKTSVISFNVAEIHPYDIGSILDKLGIAVRTGHHCAQPIMEFYKIPGTVRASFAFYNTKG